MFSQNQGGDTKSRNATEQNYVNKSDAAFAKTSGGNNNERNATEIDANFEQKSAEFGDISELNKFGSQENYLSKSDAAFGRESQIRERNHEEEEKVLGATPHMDQEGHSEESSEGVVADHRPFDGI